MFEQSIIQFKNNDILITFILPIFNLLF